MPPARWARAVSEVITPLAHEQVNNKLVRFRTIGDMTCTGAVESSAATLDEKLSKIFEKLEKAGA